MDNIYEALHFNVCCSAVWEVTDGTNYLIENSVKRLETTEKCQHVEVLSNPVYVMLSQHRQHEQRLRQQIIQNLNGALLWFWDVLRSQSPPGQSLLFLPLDLGCRALPCHLACDKNWKGRRKARKMNGNTEYVYAENQSTSKDLKRKGQISPESELVCRCYGSEQLHFNLVT